MIDSKRKEEISKSYLNAVCAVKGIAMDNHYHDEDGIDVILSKSYLVNEIEFKSLIGVQLKSTSTDYSEHADFFTYSLVKKNYNDLRVLSTIKSYLFLLILPKDERYWINHSVKQLVIKRCMYWLDLKGYPENTNISSVTVRLPKSNIVSSENLDVLLKNNAEEVLL